MIIIPSILKSYYAITRINQFGVPANVEAETAILSFFLIDLSQTAKPQDKLVWDFGNSKSKLNA